MKLSKKIPKIYTKCKKIFGVNWNKGIIITYGNTIYCKYKLPKEKIIHEKTHIKQQTKYGVKKWWSKYFKDTKFRLNQELEAYRNEWEFIQNNIIGIQKKRLMLKRIAIDLSSDIYGNIIDYKTALNLVQKQNEG